MDQFEKFMSTHGETVTQAIIDNWEKSRGIKNHLPVPLEERWKRFLKETEALSPSTAYDA